jgi:hypothetical protein
MYKEKIYKVKLTFPYDWPIMRQSIGWSGIWENYEFILNDAINECDFWIIFSDYKLKKETCKCPPGNIIFMPCEPFPIENFKYRMGFLRQFALIITCQREIIHPNVSYDLGGLPWFVNKSYDELIKIQSVKKTKKISLITSNKLRTDGHKKRLEFSYKLKDYFKEEIDLFGRGIVDFEDKWDVLAPYQYSITIENSYYDDYLTEKFFDCHLAFTYPFYYGCPNAEKYFSKKSFSRIDIDDFDATIKTIESVLSDSSHYENHFQYLASGRLNVLNKYNLFPFLVSYMKKMDGNAERKKISISQGLLKTLKGNVKKLWRIQ